MFEWWLHSEAGYSYIGPQSFYRLAIPEIRRLYGGYAVMQKQQRDQMEEENPDLRKGRVRGADIRAMEEFKKKRGLK